MPDYRLFGVHVVREGRREPPTAALDIFAGQTLRRIPMTEDELLQLAESAIKVARTLHAETP